MSTDTIIRRYRPADADAVTDLWARASKQAHPFIVGEGEGERARVLREVYLVQAENWVAERDGTVIGLLGLLPGDGDEPAEIGGLFVAPEAQGIGAGRALLEHAAALRGALTLEVFARNERSRRFYTRMGFTESGRRPDEETGHELVAMERVAPLKSVSWLHLRDGLLLSVRTAGNDTFYLPGGKYEPGETAAEALSRELAEEVGVVVPADELTVAFDIHAVAHGRDGRRLHMTCFTGGPETFEPVPGREIAEFAWLGPDDADRCAPAFRQVVARLVADGRMAG
ncbi:GNAT family N-acetyltransferase [Streptomyces celluloflavus]|uniref:GNAT family N-acetyltransferase n=1 Tax=Streptomyces celluloflavus TaxID=58344 RepID=UPI00369B6216